MSDLDAMTLARAPVVKPEFARAQVIDALETWVRAGDACWLDRRHTRILLSDGSRWQLDTASMTRLV